MRGLFHYLASPAIINASSQIVLFHNGFTTFGACMSRCIFDREATYCPGTQTNQFRCFVRPGGRYLVVSLSLVRTFSPFPLRPVCRSLFWMDMRMVQDVLQYSVAQSGNCLFRGQKSFCRFLLCIRRIYQSRKYSLSKASDITCGFVLAVS